MRSKRLEPLAAGLWRAKFDCASTQRLLSLAVDDELYISDGSNRGYNIAGVRHPSSEAALLGFVGILLLGLSCMMHESRVSDSELREDRDRSSGLHNVRVRSRLLPLRTLLLASENHVRFISPCLFPNGLSGY